VLVGCYLLAAVSLVLLRWIDPPTTALQMARRIESTTSGVVYRKRYQPVDLHQISDHLQHAVIASEDGRFYLHHGIDWVELRKVLQDGVRDGRPSRGASTISQQLVKNLYLTGCCSVVRKGAEFLLAPLAELILPKDRILELYLNVIEWGPGIYGAQAASQFHFSASASALSREQAARLASILPSPRLRKPAQATASTQKILLRMQQMGW
jgi:monofunctional biosynthetic peptidoglycan transglycosylase